LDLSLIQSIKDSELVPVTTDLAEVGLDMLLNEGVLKDIPVIGSFIGLCKAGVSIRDRLLAKKLLSFLQELSKVPRKARKAAIEKLNADVKFQKRVGENLLLLLEKANDVDKPLMLGRAFRAFLEERIDYQMFKNFGFIIDALNMSAIPKLSDIYQKFQSTKDFETNYLTSEVRHLISLGLISDHLTRTTFGADIEHTIEKTKTGKNFCDIVLELTTLRADDHELRG
jgi:hypothetical protein